MRQPDRLRGGRDLDPVAGQREPDPVAGHAVDPVALVEVVGEQPHPVLHSTFGKIACHDRRRGVFEHAEAPPDGVEDDPLDLLGGNIVGGDDKKRAARPRLRLREIADRGLGELTVGDDHVGLVERDHLRGPPIHLDDPADMGRHGVVLDPITDFERMLGVDGEAGEDVAERVLEGEPKHGGDQRRAGDELAGIDPRVPEDDQQRHGQQQATEDVDEDLRHRPGDALPDTDHDQQQGRLEERREEKKPVDMVGDPVVGISDLGEREDDDRDQRDHRQAEQRDRQPGKPAPATGSREEKNDQGHQRQDSLPDGDAVGPEDELFKGAGRRDNGNHRRFRRFPPPSPRWG